MTEAEDWEKSTISVCGVSHQENLYCGAMYEESISGTMSVYNKTTEGGRTRVKDGKATDIKSCYAAMGGTAIKDDEYMYPNAGGYTTDFKRRVGFLRGTEYEIFKENYAVPLKPMPEADDPSLYPTGYVYQGMVVKRDAESKNVNAYYVTEAGSSNGQQNVMAWVKINRTDEAFQTPCAAFNAVKGALTVAKEEAKEARDAANLSQSPEDIAKAEALEQVVKDKEQAIQDKKQEVETNLLDKFLDLSLAVQVAIITGAVILLGGLLFLVIRSAKK